MGGSQSQVEELYNYGKGRAASDISSSTTPLHAYWNFENNVEDQSLMKELNLIFHQAKEPMRI